MHWILYPEEMTLPEKQKLFSLNYDIAIGTILK
jgi:hypothetical protein